MTLSSVRHRNVRKVPREHLSNIPWPVRKCAILTIRNSAAGNTLNDPKFCLLLGGSRNLGRMVCLGLHKCSYPRAIHLCLFNVSIRIASTNAQ